MSYFKYVIALLIVEFALPSYAITINDGDFASWSFGATGTATVTREASGGNPGARLNVTTVSGSAVYGTAIKTDYSTDKSLSGLQFELQLDVLSGPGAHNEGQRIQMLVEQNSSIYGLNLDITGYPLNWDTLSFNGIFTASDFVLLNGTGLPVLNLDGGTDTYFGFAAGNTNSGTLTQYYDNFNLHIVPLPTSLLLFGSGLLGLIGIARRKKAT